MRVGIVLLLLLIPEVAGLAGLERGVNGQRGTERPGDAGRLMLVPIDDRPAVGQFGVMIGAVADQRVETPRRELLGNFTTPGDTARIEQWLRQRDCAAGR